MRTPPALTLALDWRSCIALATGALLAAGPGDAQAPTVPSGGPTVAAKLPPGYLPRGQLPDSLALLPAPPAAGTAAFARDEEVSKAAARPQDSPRWRLAASDADLGFPHAAGTFACAAGVRIDPGTTPASYRLLGKSMIDIGLSTYKAKDHYKRVRPFVAHGSSTCFPPDEAALRSDGSYPSGHSALGWGWALILAQIVPARSDAILQRGREFGQSRLVCNAHWASDVDAGRLIAAATVARLHADAAFRADLAAAGAELARASAPDASACAIEAKGLADAG